MTRSTVVPRSNFQQRSRLSLPAKPKPWSHQDELNSLIGQEIELQFVGVVNFHTCTLLHADQFSVQVSFPFHKSKVTYFKHHIASFRSK